MSIKRYLFLSILATAATPIWAGAKVVKVCNYRSATIWTAFKQYVPDGIDSRYELSGWFRFDPSQCRDLYRNYDDILWIYAKDQNGWTSSDAFYTDDFVKQDDLCVGSRSYLHVLGSVCRDKDPAYPDFRFVKAHRFGFTGKNFNVYEIGFR